MSLCKKRLIYWLLMTGSSLALGVALDFALRTAAFPSLFRLLGLSGIVLMHFPLKRTGRLLARMGGSQPHQWGCTTKLVTTDIYGCLRHPHHFGIGVFMTSLGLLIGHIWTFLILTIVQWTWIVAFLLLVEEKELEQKFGEEYKRYRSRVPMLLASPRCLMRVLASPLPRDPDGSERPV